MDEFDFSNIIPVASINGVNAITEQFERQHREHQRIVDQISEHNSKKDAALFKAADASVAQKKLLENQLGELRTQNGLLLDNYKKLEEMYGSQKEAYAETQDDLKKSIRFNTWMMIISIVAMLAAIASPIVTIIVSG